MRSLIQRKAANACVRAICAALALFAFLCIADARAEIDGMLRVKLARLGSPSEITMQADCDYTLAGDPSVRIPAGTELTVSAAGGSLSLTAGDRSVKLGASLQLLRDTSGSKGMAFLSPSLSNRFCGDLAFAASGDAITAVLRIYIEDYLYGVVGYEMAPTSGLEALKAQAVVARNYALRQKVARGGSAYDLSDSGDVLSFRGYNAAAEYASVLRAVDDTRGQVVYYDDSPATCYFCDSNGGQTESAANALGSSLPYTQVMDDPYDFDGAGIKKTAALRRDGSDLHPSLEAALVRGAAEQLAAQGVVDLEGVRVAAIEDVSVESPRFAAPSRLYQYAVITASLSGETAQGETETVRAAVRVPTYGGLEDWYDLSINDEDNETVWVARTNRAFEITFRRNGSGVGMSQRGAQVMAKKGLSCETILDYYYPGVNLRKLELRDASRESGASAASSFPASAKPIASARLSQKSRLYESADTSAAALTTLPAGATVAVYAVQGEWAAIGSGGVYGFVHAEALTSFALKDAAVVQVRNETIARINGGPVQVLQLPVTGATALETLLGGDAVRLNAYTDAWALVTTDGGVEGFIPRDALTLQTGDPAAQAGGIVAAQEDLYGLLVEDAGLYVNADDSIAPQQNLQKGAYVQILAYNSAWAYARTTDGLVGYVKLNCLSAVKQAPAQQGETIDGGAVTVAKGHPYHYVEAETLILYEGYDIESTALLTLKRGERVQLGAYNDKWACVRVNGVTGFVLRSGLSETPVADGDDADEGGVITVVEGTQYATVIENDAPLYPSRSEKDAPITRLEEGARVRLGAYNDVWACVRADGVTGFMRLETLELSAVESQDDSGVNYLECDAVATADVEMYPSGDLSGEAVATVPKGEQVHIYAYSDHCAYAAYDGQRGFVSLRYLDRVE